MFIRSFAIGLARCVRVACGRRVVFRIAPLARALGHRRGCARAFAAAPRPVDCLLVGAMAAAVVLVALLCSAAPHIGFAQVSRIGGWLP
ncbi:hypothetical protein K6W16_01430 [Burkholderia dolosa]|uniref:Uncharacterized protein n=1 Tax=Burkholderia dolosa TaxID=152500 RepID=A0A892ICQ0_9BURK|nr:MULTISPECIES: hypothetical protein [Burkholderia]AKE06242.1 hypothetical protein XM57_27260 [Burkholderia cepacia]AJY09315.1 hypothetical protein AK34_3636 [Burkholderia dolosa AU0158]AYZ95069.1 hypothetical protein EGY28_08510 [Burkholderia dolosa]ETP62869.1 hypothetical protein BDSB_21455 [Burkholderia dolosa PC543]MBR8315075.1 hypothetical protein [Burkholderia dolosa]